MPDAPAASQSRPDSVPPGPMSPGWRARILFADDDLDMRAYVTRLLGQHYDVTPVADGQAALNAALADPPDLVLSDVVMPLLDGLGLLRALRERAETRTIPIILLSARTGEECAVAGLSAGADDYLAKPFSARELLARVGTHLELSRVRRAAADELAQANRELEAFSYSVSHDLRAPLRSIAGFTEVLLEDHAAQLDEEGRAHLERVRAATERMAVLIDALLDLSRLSRSTLRRDKVDLGSLARRVFDDLRGRDPARKVDMLVESELHEHADHGLVSVILENLLSNAWKFTAHVAEPLIEVGKVEGRRPATFFVRDNGAGFDPEYAGRLFQPFQRLHSQTEFKGTGIGLATVQRAVLRHGGRVWAESAPGKGATFYFTLREGR